jgi:hypothetical protein
MDFTNGGSCGYEKASLTGTFTTDATGDAVLTTNREGNFRRFEISLGSTESFLCPAEMQLAMTYTVEKDSVTAEPAFLS